MILPRASYYHGLGPVMAETLHRFCPSERSPYKPGPLYKLLLRPAPVWSDTGDVAMILRVADREPYTYRTCSVQRRGTIRKYYSATRYRNSGYHYEVMLWRAGKEPAVVQSCGSMPEAVAGLRGLVSEW